MDARLDRLASELANRGSDSYLINAPGSRPHQRYLSGLDTSEPFITIFRQSDNTIYALIWGSDAPGARTDSHIDSVRTPAHYGVDDILLDYEAPEKRAEILRQFVRDVGIESPTVGKTFPLTTARHLESEGIEIQVVVDLLPQIRSQKTDSEISAMRTVQRATDRAFRRIRDYLNEATIVGNRIVVDNQTLTVDRIVQTARESLQQDNCLLELSPVIGCGPETADPHVHGSGTLRPGEPILIDMAPKDTETGYHADTSRTFIKGDVPSHLEDAAHSTLRALEAAIEVIEPGVSATVVDEAACSVFESDGYPTKRTHQDLDRGFLHYTGHGVGLDIHEPPHCSPNGGMLKTGQIITIEPGLYDPVFGGIRIEDSVLVTADGCEILTQVDREWRV